MDRTSPDFVQKSPSERARAAAIVRRDEQRSGKRSRIDPTTCDIDYTNDELEFMLALQRYKEERHRPFPTCKEILEILRSLGYHRREECDPVMSVV